jgi:hypothetical protein
VPLANWKLEALDLEGGAKKEADWKKLLSISS